MTNVEYAVDFLIKNGITDVFGYAGGFITPFMDALYARRSEISVHVCYNEQGAAFAAVAWAKISNKPGCCFATSGPGASNLFSGIADAWFDSVPLIAITGQINIREQKNGLPIRQKGFQEMDVEEICKSVTKYAVAVRRAEDFPDILSYAFNQSMSGRRGPVLIDFPMDIQRAVISTLPSKLIPYDLDTALKAILSAKKPVIIAGNGVNREKTRDLLLAFVKKYKIPVVTSMIALDVLPDNAYNFGFIGIYGSRVANRILSKADVVLSIGTRLDSRQTGSDLSAFLPNAKLIRVDIDPCEFSRKIKPDEIQLCIDAMEFLDQSMGMEAKACDDTAWYDKCVALRKLLSNTDLEEGNIWCAHISKYIPEGSVITADVGQNQVWIAQSLSVKNAKMLFSGGFGAMGCSLPYAVGASYALGKKPIYCFCGDGGLQMNIQELQSISAKRELLPVKIIVFDNSSLGMIRFFQTENYDSRFSYTTQESGYSHPDFVEVAKAYGMRAADVKAPEELENFTDWFLDAQPALLNLKMSIGTQIVPKLVFGQKEQSPALDDQLLKEIDALFDL